MAIFNGGNALEELIQLGINVVLHSAIVLLIRSQLGNGLFNSINGSFGASRLSHGSAQCKHQICYDL